MIVNVREVQERPRGPDLIPAGINMLVVAPERLMPDQERTRLGKIDGLLLGKITGQDIFPIERWNGDPTNRKTFRPYDGIIVICDDLAGAVEKVRKVSQVCNTPVLIISGENDSKSMSELLALQSHVTFGRSSGETVYKIMSADNITLYFMSRFIVYSAYRKLVPGGNLRNW